MVQKGLDTHYLEKEERKRREEKTSNFPITLFLIDEVNAEWTIKYIAELN